jgi:hypothetical protein
MFCEYKDALGKPGEGVHAHRVFDIAIVDVIMMIIAAIFISRTMTQRFIPVLFVLFLSGILMHRAFCVETTIDKLLFD